MDHLQASQRITMDHLQLDGEGAWWGWRRGEGGEEAWSRYCSQSQCPAEDPPDIAVLAPLSLPWNVPGEGVVWWYGE